MNKVLIVGSSTNTLTERLIETNKEIGVLQINSPNEVGEPITSILPDGFPITDMDKRQLESEMSMLQGCGVNNYSDPGLAGCRELILTEGRSAKSLFDWFSKNRRKYKNNRIYKNTVLKRRKETLNYRRNRKRKRIQKLIRKVGK